MSENEKVDINKHEVDIDILKKQNVNDLLSIKELYKKCKELEEKISQIKYIDTTINNRLQKEYKNFKKEYEELKKVIIDENVQVSLLDNIKNINSDLQDMNTVINEINLKYQDDINNINTQIETKITEIENEKTDKFVTDNMQSQINNLVLAGDGTQNLEVVQARGNFSVMNDRLNSFDKKMYDILDEQKTNVTLTPTNGKRLSVTGVVEDSGGWVVIEVDVSANEIYYLNIYAYKNSNPYLAFYDTNGEVMNLLKGTNSDGWNLLENIKIVIPLNCTKIILSTAKSDAYLVKAELTKIDSYQVKNLNKALEDIENLNNAIEDKFEVVNLSWNAGKMYNRNNATMESLSNCQCASIDVSKGETYNIKTTGYGQANPYIITNANGSKISAYPDMLIPANTTYDITVTIPDGGAKLLINNRTNVTSIGVVSKKTGVLPIGVGKIIEDVTNINKEIEFYRKNYEEAIITEQLKNDFAWKDFDKIYVTFTFDDSNSDISDIETLFESKGVPCCYATVPSRLYNSTKSGETVKEVLVRAEANGGEVLAHWQEPLTSSSTEEDYFNVYVGAKKSLTEAGFTVNGLIVSGGTNYQTQDWVKGVRYARPYYKYSDLVGQSQKITQFNHPRKFITTNDATNKGFIDNAIKEGNQWLSFASHGANDNVTIDLLSSLLDYIATKPNVEIVNFKYLYDMFGTTKLEKRLTALEGK